MYSLKVDPSAVGESLRRRTIANNLHLVADIMIDDDGIVVHLSVLAGEVVVDFELLNKALAIVDVKPD